VKQERDEALCQLGSKLPIFWYQEEQK